MGERLHESDRVWMEFNDPEYPVPMEGTILNSGSRMEYTITMTWQDGCPEGSYAFERVE